MGETNDIIEHKGPRPLDVAHHFHDAVAVFQLLKDDNRIVHAFGTYNVMILLAIPQFLQTLLRSIEIRPLDHSSAVVSELRFLACAIRLP